MAASRIVVGTLIGLAGGVAVVFSYMGLRLTRHNMKVPLQEAIAYRDGRFIRVFGVCEILDFGGNHTSVDQAFVVVEEYGVEYGSGSIVLQSSRSGEVSSSGTLVTPTWRGKYIPTGGQRLPSARAFRLNGKVYVVIFDGHTMTTYEADPEVRIDHFTQVDAVNRIPCLDALIADSFDVDDVYWSYAITGGDQFWRKEREESGPRPLLIERMYAVWKEKAGQISTE